MYRRLLLLSGLAIFAVVCNHAAGFGQIGLFLWADRYRPVTSPNWDQLGTTSSFVLLAVRQIGVFSVPAFLFVSGFFVSYAALDKRNPLGWGFVRARLSSLLPPYLIWSVVLIAGDVLQGDPRPPGEYLILLATQGVVGPFYFLPLLIYSCLLSPIVARLLQWNWKLILSCSAAIQFATVANAYLGLARPDLAWVQLIASLTPSWLPFQWIFFFTLGMCAGFHVDDLRQWLLKRDVILSCMVVLALLANIIEADAILRSRRYWGAYNGTATFNLYAVALIFWFLARAAIPGAHQLTELGSRSYGIYLTHYPFIGFTARLVRRIWPQLLAYPIVFVPALVVVGLAGPLVLMAGVRRTALKGSYRYLFG